MPHRPISTDQAPAAIGTYSQAVEADGTVYLSGQIPLDPTTMELVSQEFSTQAHQVFRNLHAVADAAGGSLADVYMGHTMVASTDGCSRNTRMK